MTRQEYERPFSHWTCKPVPLDDNSTLGGVFQQRSQMTPTAIAYTQFEQDTWQEVTWGEMEQRISKWQQALQVESLAVGDRVAVMAKNGVEWVCFEQAALRLGLVVVPLYTNDQIGNIHFILTETQAKVLFINGQAQWSQLDFLFQQHHQNYAPLTDLKTLVHQEAIKTDKCVRDGTAVSVKYLPDWLKDGVYTCNGQLQQPHVDAEALASIVYTSGTGGQSKGVMISHRNLLSNVADAMLHAAFYEEDKYLSFLPISHMLERMAGYYKPIVSGAQVVFNRSIPLLADDLALHRPTALVAVPRIFERVALRIEQNLQQKSAVSRWLFRTTVRQGWKRFQMTQQGKRFTCLLWPLLERLVAKPVQQRLGGRLRFILCGGAPLSPHIAKLFLGLDVPILQGYGLTETSVALSVNTPWCNKPHTVGYPLKRVQTKLADNGELLVKAPNVMMGYWQKPDETAAAFDEDGYFKTGDVVQMDGEHIEVTGRVKDIIVMSNGEKVSPSLIEHQILQDTLFEQVVLAGEGQPLLLAIVWLNQDVLIEAQRYVPELMPVDSATGQRVLLKRLNQQLQNLPGYAKIRGVVLAQAEFTVENGLLTPTLKIKRPKVLAQYADELEQKFSQFRKL